MARGGRGASGQRAPGAAARAQGQRRGRSARRERLPQLCPRPPGPTRLQPPLPTGCREETGTGGQRHRGGPRRPRHAARAPSARPPRAPQARKRRRTRAHLERSRGAAGARGAAASPAAAAGRGVAGKAPFSGAARACSPPPRRRRPPPAPAPAAPRARLDACSLGFPLGHRRGAARPGSPRSRCVAAARPAHGHPLAGGGGPGESGLGAE